MIQQLSFKYNPIEQIVRRSGSILPGANLVVGVYYDDNDSEVKCFVNDISKSKFENNHENLKQYTEHRLNTTNKLWLPSDCLQLDSSLSIQKTKQLKLEDELFNTTLLLKFKNEIDLKFDLVFIFFNKDKNNFELDANPQILDTSTKSIFSHILFNSFNDIIQNSKENNFIFSNLSKGYSNVQVDLTKHKKLLDETKSKLEGNLELLFQTYLATWEEKLNLKIKLTESAIQKLEEFNGSPIEVKKAIEQAVSIAYNLNENSQILEIYGHQILMENYQTEEIKPIEILELPKTFNRYTKTIQLLDKLEIAARKVLKNELPLTGKNLGICCSPSISAPAITDSIKNHKKKIISLFGQYPEKWPTIQNEFRPIQNIIPTGGFSAVG